MNDTTAFMTAVGEGISCREVVGGFIDNGVEG